MQEITSIDNPKVKQWIKLKSKKYRDIYNMFIIEGEHLVSEAVNLGLINTIITTDKTFNSFPNTYLVTDRIMNSLSSLSSSTNIIGIVNKFSEKNYDGNLLLIDQIQDPGNLGTIIRTAVAFNIKTIVLNHNTVDLYNQKTINASEGMIFHINVLKRDLNTFIDELKNKLYTIYGTSVKDGIELNKVNNNDLKAIIVGNEGQGISEDLLNKCDKKIYIKTSDLCESLNVGVATGIILHHIK